MLAVLALTAAAMSVLAAVASTRVASGSAAGKAPSAKITHEQAVSKLQAAGLPWRSSHSCVERRDPRCTSFEQINVDTITRIIAFRNESGCDLMLTGGTEVGHSSGVYSHWNGHKIDFSPSNCAAKYIRDNYSPVRVPGWGSEQWTDRAGNLYTNEDDHWDITFY